MLDEDQEEELADWWRDNPGLYDKSVETYLRKSRKDKLIANKAASMGVSGLHAAMLSGWMKSMRTMYDKEEKKSKGKSGAAPRILTVLAKNGSSTLSASSVPTSRLGPKGEYLAK